VKLGIADTTTRLPLPETDAMRGILDVFSGGWSSSTLSSRGSNEDQELEMALRLSHDQQREDAIDRAQTAMQQW